MKKSDKALLILVKQLSKLMLTRGRMVYSGNKRGLELIERQIKKLRKEFDAFEGDEEKTKKKKGAING